MSPYNKTNLIPKDTESLLLGTVSWITERDDVTTKTNLVVNKQSEKDRQQACKQRRVGGGGLGVVFPSVESITERSLCVATHYLD